METARDGIGLRERPGWFSLAIWKAVVIDNCFKGLGEVKTCGEWRPRPCDRLLPARSQGTSRLGGISFWGNFTVTGRHEPAFQIASIE